MKHAGQFLVGKNCARKEKKWQANIFWYTGWNYSLSLTL